MTTFPSAIDRLMTIRRLARQFGRELKCHRNVYNARVTDNLTMPQAVQVLSRDKQRALMQWLTTYGPFWNDDQRHDSDGWFEFDGDIVTDTALGEAAYCILHGIACSVVSMNPSSWLISSLSVEWYEGARVRRVDVRNFWEVDDLKAVFEADPAPIESWNGLEVAARTRCPDLTFSSDSFGPLRGHPFAKSAAFALLSRLSTLQEYKNCFNETGERTSEGHAIYQKHFTGRNAWFTDSSSTEKADFRTDLTFPHPEIQGNSLFCTWHGKVKTSQLRIHFSWPIRANEPLYVVYVGPKITKQ